MKKKKESIHELIKKKFGTNKLYDEKFTNKTYWEWAEEHQRGKHTAGDHQIEFIEPSQANPDVLSQSVSPWTPELSEESRSRIDSIRDGLYLLTDQEKHIVDLCARGLSLAEAAAKLGLKKSAAQSALERARKKLRKFHSVRKSL